MSSQTIFITGVSSGLGFDFASALLEQGYVVYGGARDLTALTPLIQKGLKAVPLDLCDDESILNAAQEIMQNGACLDVLINNAGIGIYGALEDMPLSTAREQFEVNLFGHARLTQLLLPAMRQKGRGKIISVSSMSGRLYSPLAGWYHASKHALEAWSDCLRLELHPFGIHVVLIEPGAVATEFSHKMLKRFETHSAHTPYAPLTARLKAHTLRTVAQHKRSPPRVITRVLLKAIKAKNPKRRYVAGKYARLFLFCRRFLGDAFFDQLMLRAFKWRRARSSRT